MTQKDSSEANYSSILRGAIEEGLTLIPVLFTLLLAEGLLDDFLCLMRLISNGRFPTKNIAFLLLMDVARWYDCTSTKQMFYRDQTTLFWKIGYKLFHGKFLRFMGGSRSPNDTLSADTQMQSVNFAVPTENTV